MQTSGYISFYNGRSVTFLNVQIYESKGEIIKSYEVTMKEKNKVKEEYPGPPGHLSEKSKALWHEFVGIRVTSPGRILSFQQALESLDLAEEARETRQREGLTVTTERSGVSHAHPLLKVERENRQLFLKVWAKLGLDWNFYDGSEETCWEGVDGFGLHTGRS